MTPKFYKSIFLSTFLIAYLAMDNHAQSTHPLLDSLIQEVLQQQTIPAMAAAVVQLDTIHFGIAGQNKAGQGTLVNLSHKFHLGSNTKAFTSLMAMKLVEQGKITWESSFFDYFPQLQQEADSSYYLTTLGELLSHQARMPAFTSGLEFEQLPEMGNSLSERKLNFAKAVLAQAPVRKGTYSNAGYVLAGLLLEQVSGKSYEELLDATLQTLQLDYTLGAPNKERYANPWGHWEDNGVLIAHGPQHEYQLQDFMLPAGDLSMNVVDYAQFVQLHLQGLKGTGNYLKANNYQLLHYGLEDYSYGWGNEKQGEHLVSYHDGSLGTFYAHTIVVPSLDIAVIVLTNSAEEAHIEAIYQLRGKLMSLRQQF